MSQPLPLTLIQPVAADSTMPVPLNWLPMILPPVVPSLMSMFSAVVSAMLLPIRMLPSLRSGWQPEYRHQFLCAEPT